MSYKTDVWANGLKDFEYNDKFGALDIETYKNQGASGDGLQIPYAAGFTDFKGVPTVFYVEEGEPDFGVLVRTLQALLVQKYNGGTFYVHNLARFDSRLILVALGMMDDVKCTVWGRDMCNIFRIRISKSVSKKRINIVLQDSLYQLPFKLDVLGKKFNTDIKKTVFPYGFVTRDTLFYNGVMPDFSFYKNHLTECDYNKTFKQE